MKSLDAREKDKIHFNFAMTLYVAIFAENSTSFRDMISFINPSLDGKEWKRSKFFHIIQSYIIQTRTESLKP